MVKIKALIFDFDGLILETEMPVFKAWSECYEAHGLELNLEKYAACVGSDVSGFDPVNDLENRYTGTIDWDYWNQKRRESVQKRLSNKAPLPGVEKRLKEAGNEGLPCVVASSSPRCWVEPLLEKLNLMHHFKSTHCLDDVENPKPNPELFLAASEFLGVKPHEALVFEDSLNGLNAALEAGMQCVVIPSPVTKHLQFEGASLRIDSLEELSLIEIIELL